jgi:hypothetical protein
VADDGGLVGGWQAPPRGPADEESLQAAVRAAVEAEAADLRSAVDAGLRDIAARADEVLGSALGDLAIRFGEQLKTSQTAAATRHDDRRIDAQTANRVRAMEDRLDELISRIDGRDAAAPVVADQTFEEQIAGLERALEVHSRQLEEVILRLEAAVAGIAEVIGDGDRPASSLEDRVEKVGDAVVARIDGLERLFTLIVEGDPERDAEQRRQLIADLKRAMNVGGEADR